MSTLSLHSHQEPHLATAKSSPSRMRRFAALMLRWFVRALARHRANRALRELGHLDDRMLKDIGLSRCSLDHVVYARMQEMIDFSAPSIRGMRESRPICDCEECRRLR